MTRNILVKYKLYVEGKREYIFFSHLIKITNNKKKYIDPYNLNGGGHLSMYENIDNSNFQGHKIWIVDNRDNKKGNEYVNILENEKLIYKCKENKIRLIVSDKKFDDEIILFLNIDNTENDSKKSIDKYLNNNKLEFEDFIKSKIKDKNYIKDNLEKIKNQDFKNLLQEILDSYKEDDLL